MKIITKNLKLIALLFILSSAVITRAQCAANFVYTYGSNGSVTFTSTSVLSNSTATTFYSWNFGNNTTYTASGFSGMFANTTYTANGQYVVTLYILTPSPTCSSVVQYTLTITNAAGCGLNANANYSQGTNGVVNFNNTTTGTIPGTTYIWNFGDNSALNTTASPAHTYSANGTYTAKLLAVNSSTCTDSVNVIVNVNSYCTLVASLSSTLGANGLVTLKSTSTGTTSSTAYNWQFGDGASMNAGPLVNHTYINGAYTATLTVSNNSVNPGCIDTVMQSITVTSNTCNLLASFTETIGANGVVNFLSTTSGATSATTYTWILGSNFTSNATNPTVTYPSGGIYYVTLTARTASNCSSTITRTVNVNTLPCVANASFSLIPTSTLQYWSAIPSGGNNQMASWSWGDNTPNTNTLYASHQYSAAGMYNICLTVTASCGATASACATYSVYRATAGAAIIYVNVLPPTLKSVDNTNNVGIASLPEFNQAISLYPNPTTGLFSVKMDGFTGDKVTVSVYNVTGTLLYNKLADTKNGSFESNINLDNASTGIYFVQVTGQGKTITQKLVINK